MADISGGDNWAKWFVKDRLYNLRWQLNGHAVSATFSHHRNIILRCFEYNLKLNLFMAECWIQRFMIIRFGTCCFGYFLFGRFWSCRENLYHSRFGSLSLYHLRFLFSYLQHGAVVPRRHSTLRLADCCLNICLFSPPFLFVWLVSLAVDATRACVLGFFMDR